MGKAGGFIGFQLELTEQLRTATSADVWEEMFRQTAEVSKCLKGTYVKTLRESMKLLLATSKPEMARMMVITPGVLAIMEARIMALEAKNEALRKERASSSAAEKSVESRLTMIKRKIEELGTALIRLIRRTPTKFR